MEISILQLSQGAKKAKGITVIIDVFRAYTTENWAFQQGAKRIYPVPEIEVALELGRQNPQWLVAGEREGKKLPGFDFGNSPHEISQHNLSGKTLVHCTSAGTQGIAAATQADEILVAALVNAKATADYIASKKPAYVSLVCMGKADVEPTEEDTYCAEYIESLLLGKGFDQKAVIEELRLGEGARFFDPANVGFSPPEDFYLCTEFDRFDNVLKVFYDENGLAYVNKFEKKD
ncbi:MAG: 2-phosphosulfolactate phosphatase [Firmicutes bacterium]|jgi:2-phosphosulfolactate phosphatase|nr:2-phosphosulfolactate phosphatase [Bacillota bacterium]